MNSTADRTWFGGVRESVILRDLSSCVLCGINRSEHFIKYGRDITVDHIDGRGRGSDEKNNDMDNLQTLCLGCHGKKDSPKKLTPEMAMRIYNAKTMDNAYILCDLFGVNRQAGYDIRSGKSWSSVTGSKRKDQL